MKLGIVGLPNAGKSMLFEALTRSMPTQNLSRGESRIGTIRVPDARVDFLSDLYRPKKTIYTQVEYLLPIAKGNSKEKDQNPWNLALDGTFIVRDYEINKDREPELYEEAKKIQRGDLSGVIRTPDSFHIIKLKEFSPEKRPTFEEAKGYLEGRLKVKAERKRLEEWKAELEKEATIEIIETPGGSIKTE